MKTWKFVVGTWQGHIDGGGDGWDYGYGNTRGNGQSVWLTQPIGDGGNGRGDGDAQKKVLHEVKE